MDDPTTRHLGFNAASLGQWGGFAPHRARVSALLGAGGPPGGGRLCVLGAGNANDLDLAAIRAAHREVHLVDLDAGALERGAERQGLAGDPALRRHGGLDLTGMLGAIAGWSPDAPVGPADLRALADWPPDRVAMALPGPFDRVASTCLLSQIVGNASAGLGERHPRFADAVRAIRRGHLRLLARLARPGGEVVLVTDVVASGRLPGLEAIPEADLPGLLPRLAREGGLIHGVNPREILAGVRDDPDLAATLGPPSVVPPWRWRLHDRTYLVYAIRWRIGAAGRPGL